MVAALEFQFLSFWLALEAGSRWTLTLESSCLEIITAEGGALRCWVMTEKLRKTDIWSLSVQYGMSI